MSWQPAAILATGLAIGLAVRSGVEPPGPSGAGESVPGVTEPEVIRVKGGIGLTVQRERAGVAEPIFSGDSATAGDSLQFEVDLPADGFALILGVEASGKTWVTFPTSGAQDAVPVLGGDDQALPGTAVLDGSVGEEWLGLVWCEKAFEASALAWSGSKQRVDAPEGCRTTAFRLVKTAK